jgi:hypothetical protein
MTGFMCTSVTLGTTHTLSPETTYVSPSAAAAHLKVSQSSHFIHKRGDDFLSGLEQVVLKQFNFPMALRTKKTFHIHEKQRRVRGAKNTK